MVHHINKILVDIEVGDQDDGYQIRETVTVLFNEASANEVGRLMDRNSNFRSLIIYNEMVLSITLEEGQYSQFDIQEAILRALAAKLEMRNYHMEIDGPQPPLDRASAKGSDGFSASRHTMGSSPMAVSESGYPDQTSALDADPYYYDTYEDALFHRIVEFLKSGTYVGLHDLDNDAFKAVIRYQLTNDIAGFNQQMLLLESESEAVFHRIVNLFPVNLLKEWLIRSAASFGLEGQSLYQIIQRIFKIIPLKSDFLFRSLILEGIYLVPRLGNSELDRALGWIKEYTYVFAQDFAPKDLISGLLFFEMMIDFPKEDIFKNIGNLIYRRLPGYKPLLPEIYKTKMQGRQVEKQKLFIDLISGKLDATSTHVQKNFIPDITRFHKMAAPRHTQFVFSTFAYLLLYGRLPFWLASAESLTAAFYAELAIVIRENRSDFKTFYKEYIAIEYDASEIIIFNLTHLFENDIIYLFLEAVRDDLQQETTLMQHYFYKYKDALQYLAIRDSLLENFFKPGFSVYKEDVMFFLLDTTVNNVVPKTKKELFILFMLYELEKIAGKVISSVSVDDLAEMADLSFVWESNAELPTGIIFNRDKLMQLVLLLMAAKKGEMFDLSVWYRADTFNVHSFFDIKGRMKQPGFYDALTMFDSRRESKTEIDDDKTWGLTSGDGRLLRLFGLDWMTSKRMGFSNDGGYLLYYAVVALIPMGEAVDLIPADEAIALKPMDEAISLIPTDEAIDLIPTDDANGLIPTDEAIALIPEGESMALVPTGEARKTRKEIILGIDFMNVLTQADTTVLDATARMFFHDVFSEEAAKPSFHYVNALHYFLMYPDRLALTEALTMEGTQSDAARYLEYDIKAVLEHVIGKISDMVTVVEEEVRKNKVDHLLEGFYKEFMKHMNTITDGYFKSFEHLKAVLSNADHRKQFMDYVLINYIGLRVDIKGDTKAWTAVLPAKLIVLIEELKLISPERLHQMLLSFTTYYVNISRWSSVEKLLHNLSEETRKTYPGEIITPVHPTETVDHHVFNAELFVRIKMRFERLHQQHPIVGQWSVTGIPLTEMPFNDMVSFSQRFRLDDYFDVQVKQFVINYAHAISKPVTEVSYSLLKNFIDFEPNADRFPGSRFVFYKFVFTLYELFSQLLLNPQTSETKEDRKDQSEISKSEFVPTVWKLDTSDDQGSQIVSNAGLVICGPYITLLFQRLDLLNEKKQLKDNSSINRGVFILNYLCFGNIVQKEYHFGLNNVFCNVPKDFAYDFSIKLTKKEKDTCESLLQNICTQWEALKSTSPDGLRHNFMIREGALSFDGSSYKLVVAKKPYDILVTRIPWTIGTLKFPWMEYFLYTEWG